MSDLDPTMAVDVIVASEAASNDAAEVLSRGLESQLTLAVDPQPGVYAREAPPAWASGGGLAMSLEFDGGGLLMLLPEAGGVLPEWVRKPNATQTSQLNTLAQELGVLLLPETLLARQFTAHWVPDLAEGLARCEVAADAAVVTLDITGKEKGGALYLVWPCSSPQLLAPAEMDEGETSDAAEEAAREPQPAPEPATRQKPKELTDLPPYARHLLKIRVPVMVNLVSKKQSIEEIMELGPGAIVNFEKSCDDPLELMVGNRRVALGSAVKVGDKFGIEITEISLPDESFVPVVVPRARPA